MHGMSETFTRQMEHWALEVKKKVKKKVKLSRYTPWRHMGGEEV
jgi:hypothetical protein